MTDRHAGYVITLEKDVRSDDNGRIIEALKMIKGVASVDPVISSIDFHLSYGRLRLRIIERLLEVLHETKWDA